jgi:protein SCO1
MQPLLTKKQVIAIVVITSLCIAIWGAARLWFDRAKYTALETLPMPQQLPDFRLYYSGPNHYFTTEQIKGQWSLVFFGFSHCVDVCPMELEIIGRVLKNLPLGKQKIRGIFISLDPERDSQQLIDEYLSAFGSSINGVRGDHSELVKLVRFFGADYNRLVEFNGAAVNIPAGYAVPLGSSDDYQVDHSSRIYLVNPLGQYIGSFPPPHDVTHIINDLQTILKR